MTTNLSVESRNDMVTRLVSDFARGLGCSVTTQGHRVRAEVTGGAETLIELLTQTALIATKAGVGLEEPACRVTYRHEGASSAVTIGLRITDFSLDSTDASRV